MKKTIILLAITICIATSLLTDTFAIYTKTAPAIYGTITAKNNDCSHYLLWDVSKELTHEYKNNDIVQYSGKLYLRINSGSSQNHLTPDKNKSWVIIVCDKCKM